MSKFPIAQLLKDGMLPIGMDGLGVEDMLRSDVIRTTLASESIAFFDISMPAELYWTGRKDYYHLDHDFGPLRPPFDNIWMEWEVPRHVMIEGKDFDLEGRPKNGAMVNTHITEDFLTITVLLYMLDEQSDPPRPIFLPYGHQIGLHPDGRFNGWSKAMVPSRKIPEGMIDTAKELSDANPVWMALNLINCRNVSTRQVGSALSRTTREKRQGVPVKRYHTIVLPGMSYCYAGGRDRGQERAQLAAHRVRGHFKTFTPEAPLLGKHVGTFWWGWAVRGSKEHGEVVSDYKLGETGS